MTSIEQAGQKGCASLPTIPADEHGRPLALADRLAGLIDILSREGAAVAPSIVQAMAWWEECLSPSIGCDVRASAGWTRTRHGPESEAVSALLRSWMEAGELTRFQEQPIRSEALLASGPLSARGGAASGKVPSVHDAPNAYLPWYRTMLGFAMGLFDPDGFRCSGFETERDVAQVLRHDPVYACDAWETVGGPAHAIAAPASPSGRDPLASPGNSAAYAISFWRTDTSGPGGRPVSRDLFQSVWLYGRFLCRRTAGFCPSLGDARFLELHRTLHALETVPDADGVVSADLMMEGRRVARMQWRPATRVHEWKGLEGRAMTSTVEDGRLLVLEVEPSVRRKGIGTYALRHAMSRGCVHAPDPGVDAASLWGSHGWPGEEGGWHLQRMSWPTCPTAVPIRPEGVARPFDEVTGSPGPPARP